MSSVRIWALVPWLVLALLCALLVDLRGDFPLNDDWAYALPVKALLEEGRLRWTDWQSMPHLTQSLWGAGFSLFSGFSFTALRISTYVAGVIGGFGFYTLLRLRGSRGPALVGALSLVFCPLYFGMSVTFMTDIFSLALTIWSAVYFLKALETIRTSILVIATLLSVLATLERQLGLVAPLAFAIAGYFRYSLKGWLTRCLWPFGITGVCLFLYGRYLVETDQLPALYHLRTHQLQDALGALASAELGVLRPFFIRLLQLNVFVGCFGLPILAYYRGAIVLPYEGRFVRLAAVVLLAVGMTAVLAQQGATLPSPGNILMNFGIGPETIPGGGPDIRSRFFWLALTFGGMCAGLVLLLQVAEWLLHLFRTSSETRSMAVYLLSLAVIPFVATGLAFGPFFDRYCLASIPFLWALFSCSQEERTIARPHAGSLPFALVVIFGVSSIVASHDYLAWNRARWRMVQWSQAQGISALDFDGGFEWNSYLFLLPRKNWQKTEFNPIARRETGYRLTMVRHGSEVVVARFPVGEWLPSTPSEVLVVRTR